MNAKVDYKNVLNEQQLEAVMTTKGPVLVIAGAGSGKTRTLIYRVARLVETGVEPGSILLLTFTRKAASEMLDRASGLADERCRRVSGGTFHSLAHRLLRPNAELIGFDRSYTILDRPDMEEVLQALVKEIKISKGSVRFPKRGTLASILSKAVNVQQPVEYVVREEYVQFLEYTPQINRIHKLYQDYKKTNQLMDYDDLLIFFRQLLSENADFRKEINRIYGYIMVDEYQDTNGIQADIVKWLSLEHRNIMVVGDDSQSIYSFRGADYKNMFDFPVLFPDAKIIKLEQNYRSTQPILSLTNSIMDQAVEKYTKCLFTKRKGGEKPKVINVGTEPEQALFIAQTIKEYLNQGFYLNQMAVLFRAAFHSFELELELARQDIPFVKYGGFKFMDSAHIKDLLAHLRVLINRNDTISWGRILRLVKNIGQKKSQSIINWIKEEDIQPWQIHEWSGYGRTDNGLKSLSDLMKRLCEDGVSPERAVELVNQYYDPILREQFDNFPKRQKDLDHMIPMAGRYKNLRTFLDDLVLEPPTSSSDINSGPGDDYLTLSTVHSSKGLEWPVVFIIWVMEGYFPSSKAHSSMESIEEERRLMYVATTRAKDHLIMCYPGREELPVWQMADIGYRTGLSSFIQSLSPEVLEHKSPQRRGLGGWTFRQERMKSFDIPKPGSFSFSSKAKGTGAEGLSGLRPGDRVRHPAFGNGVISKFIGKTKVEVLFRDVGRKLLHLEHTILEKV